MFKEHTRAYFFLTGVTGSLGRHTLYELLLLFAEGRLSGKIYLLIRNNGKSPKERLMELLEHSYIPDYLKDYDINHFLSYIECVEGDLNDDDLKQKIEASVNIQDKLFVIHTASCTSFFTDSKTEKTIYTNNYIGSKNLLEAFADYHIKFVFISTAYSSGVIEGQVPNSFSGLSNQEFRNPYEKYKSIFERELQEYCTNKGIEYMILRPSTICGRLLDKPLFFIPKFDVLYGWAKFFHYIKRKGLSENIRIFINKDCGLNIIPVDYAAKAVIKAFMTDIKELNIVHSFSTPVVFAMDRILNILEYRNFEYVDKAPENLNKTESFYYRTVDRAFNKYVTCPRHEFDTELLRQVMAGINEPSITDVYDGLIHFAISKNFEDMG